ncbi:MAG: (2Fe-2S)-binding protein [Anaerolineae bacterium]
MLITIEINGEQRTFDIHPGMTLLELLRSQGFYGVKHGCETGECGVCAVIMDGRLVNTCVMLAAQADGHAIITIEGIGTPDHLHPLQQAFVDHGAIQCGYCTPAQILAAKALLDENPAPTHEEVLDALSGVLCRCTGYKKPVEAVKAVIAEQGGGRHAS